MKDEFLSILSHELRTPLTAVLGWARMLRSGTLDAQATERAIEVIERNTTAQRRLIEDLLDVAQIVAGRIRLNLESTDVVPLVSSALESVRPSAAAKGIKLVSALNVQIEPISADPERLHQVILNLLTNAIKFTPDGGTVETRLENAPGAVRLSVRDTGIGIELELLPQIFEPFRQADASDRRRGGGLGLGLAIVRHLVEAHGGTVSAESDGPGVGASFTILLPAEATIAGPSLSASRNFADAVFECPPVLEGRKILIVDDDPDIRDVVQMILTKCRAVVVAVDSMGAARRELAEQRYDALVLDISLPEEDGLAFMANEGTRLARGIPTLALTARARELDKQRAREVGFTDYLSNPVEPQRLVETVARFLA